MQCATYGHGDPLLIKSEPDFEFLVKYERKLNMLKNSLYTGCPGRNVPDFGRMFLKLKYTNLTKNTCIRS
jgi:hypothetical protein